MAILALALVEAIRRRLDDTGGDTGPPSAGRYAYWQEDDSGCLWKNRELVLYLNQAVRDLSNRAPLLGTVVLRLKAGQRSYPLDDSIMRVHRVVRQSDGQPLVKATVAEVESVTRWHPVQRTLGTADWRAKTGWPTHYLLDEEAGFISVYPAPVVEQVDTLTISAGLFYPTPPAWDDVAKEATPTAELEFIADDLDEALIAGVCARAYRKRDADTYSAALAQQYDREFSEAVGPPMSQKRLDAEARWTDMPVAADANTFYAR